MAFINVAINFVYEYFSFGIYFSKHFFSKFVSNFFFPKIFFQLLFKICFLRLYSRCSPVYRDKTDSMYLCYGKYDIQVNIVFGLQHTKFSVLRLILCPGNYTTLSFKIQNSKFETQSKFEIPSLNPKFKIYEHAHTNFEL